MQLQLCLDVIAYDMFFQSDHYFIVMLLFLFDYENVDEKILEQESWIIHVENQINDSETMNADEVEWVNCDNNNNHEEIDHKSEGEPINEDTESLPFS